MIRDSSQAYHHYLKEVACVRTLSMSQPAKIAAEFISSGSAVPQHNSSSNFISSWNLGHNAQILMWKRTWVARLAQSWLLQKSLWVFATSMQVLRLSPHLPQTSLTNISTAPAVVSAFLNCLWLEPFERKLIHADAEEDKAQKQIPFAGDSAGLSHHSLLAPITSAESQFLVRRLELVSKKIWWSSSS